MNAMPLSSNQDLALKIKRNMRIIRLTAVLVASFSQPVGAWAQAPGSFIQAELQTAIKAKRAKVGDTVKARVVNAVPLPDGTLISTGTILLGEIRASEPNSISISFDWMEKDDQKTKLLLSIRAAMMPGGPRSETKSAQTGSVIGMPGVSLEIDEGPQHASKFGSASKDFQLKQGMQLMLAVVQ